MKIKKQKAFKYKISEEKILTICNNISENADIAEMLKTDLVECIKYWQDRQMEMNNFNNTILGDMSLLWLNKVNERAKLIKLKE